VRPQDVLPKLKEVEKMVLELHVKMPTANSRTRFEKIIGMRRQVEAHLKQTMTDEWKDKLNKKAAEVEWALKNDNHVAELPPPPPRVEGQTWEFRRSRADLVEADLAKQIEHQRLADTARLLEDGEPGASLARTTAPRGVGGVGGFGRFRRGRRVVRRSVPAVDEEEEDDGEAEEVVVVRRPRRVATIPA